MKTDNEASEVTEVEIDRNTALAGIVAMMGWKKPAQLDVAISGTVSIEAVRAIMERAFAPIRDVPAPEVIPIEQVSHVLIDIQPPPSDQGSCVDEQLKLAPVRDIRPKFDLNAARAALKDEE